MGGDGNGIYCQYHPVHRRGDFPWQTFCCGDARGNLSLPLVHGDAYATQQPLCAVCGAYYCGERSAFGGVFRGAPVWRRDRFRRTRRCEYGRDGYPAAYSQQALRRAHRCDDVDAGYYHCPHSADRRRHARDGALRHSHYADRRAARGCCLSDRVKAYSGQDYFPQISRDQADDLK